MYNCDGSYLGLHRLLSITVVIYHYKDDIVFITQDQGGDEVECNNIDIICAMGYNWLLSQIR